MVRIEQIIQGQAMDHIDGIGEIRMNLDRFEIGNDQQRRIVQGQGVLLQLPEGRAKVLVFALVLPGETAPAPDIGPALAAAGFLHALLER